MNQQTEIKTEAQRFKNLRAAIQEDTLNDLGDDLQRLKNNPEDCRSYTRFKGTHEQKYKKAVNYLKKYYAKRGEAALKRLEAVEEAPEFGQTKLILTLEWTKSRTWGANPRVYTNFGYKGSSISGCGYCKTSTATAEGLNSYLPLLKEIYRAKDNFLKNAPYYYKSDDGGYHHKKGELMKQCDINREFLGYGCGYGVLPRFEGGVGVSSHQGTLNKLGFKMDSVTDTKSTNVYIIYKGA